MSKSLILFSVVIPTYNCLPFLKKAIQSVLLQTEQNFEILIIDNTSTDGTKEYLSSFKDSRIHSFEVQNYGAIAVSRNTGIKNAKGSWICFLDADDIWYKEKLETCRKYINERVDVIYHDLLKYGNVHFLERKVLGSRKLNTPVLIDLLVKGNAINNSSAIVRREILKKVNYLDESVDIIAAEDYNAWLKIAEKSENFLYIDKVLGEYFIGEANTSNKNMSMCSKRASTSFTKYLNKKQLIKYDARLAYTFGRYKYVNKDYYSAVAYLFTSAKGASFRLKIRSIYMLISIYFNKVKNFLYKYN
jgi:glycosyltransferase involved in cell wall biosynthesis